VNTFVEMVVAGCWPFDPTEWPCNSSITSQRLRVNLRLWN